MILSSARLRIITVVLAMITCVEASPAFAGWGVSFRGPSIGQVMSGIKRYKQGMYGQSYRRKPPVARQPAPQPYRRPQAAKRPAPRPSVYPASPPPAEPLPSKPANTVSKKAATTHEADTASDAKSVANTAQTPAGEPSGIDSQRKPAKRPQYAGPADLEVVDIRRVSDDSGDGSEPMFRVSIRNKGGEDIFVPFAVSVTGISSNSDRKPPRATRVIDGLAGGDDVSIEFTLTSDDKGSPAPPVEAVFVAVDSQERVDEPDEDNNLVELSARDIPLGDPASRSTQGRLAHQ